MILSIIFVFFAAFFFSYLIVPANIKFSKKFSLLDTPNQRSIHDKVVPLAGGLSMAIPIILFQLFFHRIFPSLAKNYTILSVCGILIVILGILDDKKKFTANYKLFFQVIIAVILYYNGFQISLLTNPFGENLQLGWFSFPLTITWFVLVMNAFNLIDGLDGLATGIALIVNLVLFAVGLHYNNYAVALLSIALVGSTAAFLRYNFFPAKIFMGDTGSLFLGMNISAISAAGTAQYKGITAMTLLIPIIALFIPISDTIIAVFRRIRQNKNIFEADKKHLHHKMLALGFSQKVIALIGYFITFLFGLVAFGFSFASQKIFLAILFVLFVIIFIFFLIHKELHK